MMTQADPARFLPGQHDRAKLMRYDTAVILKRFFFVEESLILNQAGWLAGVGPLDAKHILAKHLWEDSLTAEAQRTRVFELRYPSRLMEIGDEEPLMRLVNEAINAPNGLAAVQALAQVFKPALAKAYRAYLDLADVIGDGPSIRFMELAFKEKARQIEELTGLLPLLRAYHPEDIASADAWSGEIERRLKAMGGIGLDPVEAKAGEPVTLPGRKPFKLAQIPERDRRFKKVTYYWPDVIDPTFPYGDGLSLQIRSAISHLNEVWAVETGGALLQAFAQDLGWEFVLDAARWTYDESRHMRMGYERLMAWGYKPEELPLGNYIYMAAYEQDPIYRLGSLYFFETKNIKRKPERIKSFADFSDDVSRHDMDFDWADETIHAAYGTKWLTRLMQVRGEAKPDPHVVREAVGKMVQAVVDRATDTDRREIRAIAAAILAKAEQVAAG
ncbi:MAG: DUF455 family protein [Chloroflexi bacterium]|nr:DUF455 family protein [Chloroflexota bacterium]